MPQSNPEAESSTPAVEASGDRLLKRLADLAQVGWEAELAIITNGILISGTLISSQSYRTALATSIRTLSKPESPFYDVDSVIAASIEADDPPAPGGRDRKYIHLADVRVAGREQVWVPYLRMRLAAVSGFWVVGAAAIGEDEGD